MEAGTWPLKTANGSCGGMDWDDPARIQSWEELIGWIDEIGFLPLFKNEVDGFSVEENTSDLYWWTGDAEQDPWEWRRAHRPQRPGGLRQVFRQEGRLHLQSVVPALRQLAAGRLRLRQPLGRGAGPHAPEADHGPASLDRSEWFSFELKRQAGFGKGGEKNFEGTVTDLQMGGYLLIRDFRQRHQQEGAVPYGWPISVYTTPEALWGYDHICLRLLAPGRSSPAELILRPCAEKLPRRHRRDPRRRARLERVKGEAMIRDICRDEAFLAQKAEPADAGGPADGRRPAGDAGAPQGRLRGHGGQHDRREQAHHRL